MPLLVRAVCALFLLMLSVSTAQAEKNLVRPPGTTRYPAMVKQSTSPAEYDKIPAACMTLSSLGKFAQGRDLWMVSVGNGSKTIFYLCRQHGHEPASTDGALAFLTALVKSDTDSPLAKCLAQVTVYVVPMANPDGAEAFRRHNAHDVDLNRDWLKRTQPETRALYAALMRLHPDVTVDCDETQGVVQGPMQAEGFVTVIHLVTDTHPARLAHRYASVVAGLPTILFETNRLNGRGRTVADRAAAQEQFMITALRDMAGKRQQLLMKAAFWHAAHPPMLASRHKSPQGLTDGPQAPASEKGTD